MNAVSLHHLWNYLRGLSLTASNQRWLGERLIEASTEHNISSDEEKKLKKLNALFGAWSGKDGERIENVVREARKADYERELVSMND
ncbi:MAG: hypothetical protein K6B13_05800 [Prevotella sp.]|nr:hypothetical protein [Prevotella sp.]